MAQDAVQGRDITGRAHTLAGIGILASLAPRELALLAAECEWHSFARGDILLNLDSGDRLDGVTFVVAGSLRLARSLGGAGRIFYTDVNEGGQFGEMAVFGVEEDGLSVVAREDGLAATLPDESFIGLLSREESVSRALLCQYARLLRAKESSVPAQSGATEGTGAQRLYGELLALAEPWRNDEGRDCLRIARLPRHRELAARVDTTEEVVARAIAELVREGIALRDYPGLIVADEARLRDLCASA
ncbi:MAG: Crp/Fnr family transcriptional regulator [Parvibaculaceae bacterium]|nr:Crp/Fnr family transcriptional regulator [Parvibaculaceae bacterium]